MGFAYIGVGGKNRVHQDVAQQATDMSSEDSRFNVHGRFKNPITSPENADILRGVPLGTYVSRNTVPPGILVIANFLNPDECRYLLDNTKDVAGVSTKDTEKVRQGLASKDDPGLRVTDRVPLGHIASRVNEIYRRLYLGQVGPFYNVEIEQYEFPELLRYSAGGQYAPHADAENWDPDNLRWTRILDRDFSTLVYLDSDFEGGELVFNNFNFKIAPKAGLLVSFPSDHRYLHVAKQITSGQRNVLVSWACAKGTERVQDAPAKTAVFIDR